MPGYEPAEGPVSYGAPIDDGYSAQAGTPPDNAFNPTRPFGGQSAITAPPGTAAYEEQQNERRYFCEYAPERC